MGITIKQTQIETVPEGIYQATIAEIEPVDGQYGPQLKITFELDQPEGKTLTGWCSQSFNVKSKLFAWTRAAFGGRDIPVGWDLDTDRLLGRRVQLVVKKAKGSDGTEFNKIGDVLPFGVNGGRTVQAPTPVPSGPVPVRSQAPDDWPPFDEDSTPPSGDDLPF